jgi:prolyl oligopeptidase
MRSLVLALLASTSLMTSRRIAAEPRPPPTEARTPLSELGKNDPYLWMEEIEGSGHGLGQGPERADPAGAAGRRPLRRRSRPGPGDPQRQGPRARRVVRRRRLLRNFWQDADHVRGLWRKTTLESYRTAEPQSGRPSSTSTPCPRPRSANWVFKGASCLPPEETRCLITLSDGGKDAVTVREFDTTTKTFVEGGFVLPEGKQNVYLAGQGHPAGRPRMGAGPVTKSGYAYVLKTLKRGQALAGAKEVFRGTGPTSRSAPTPCATRRQGRGRDGPSRRHLLRERDLSADRQAR